MHSLEKHTNKKRFVAFVDVLGYGGILVGQGIKSEGKRLEYLTQIWENLCVFLDDSRQKYENLKTILFSDSIFISSEFSSELLSCLTDIYVYAHNYYIEYPKHWMPWLRSGVSHNWVVEMKDSSISDIISSKKYVFRNPAGPALAEAYYLSEKSNYKGMRILVPKYIMKDYIIEVKTGSRLSHSVTNFAEYLVRDEWPHAGKSDICGSSYDIYDLPWWWTLNSGYGPDPTVFKSHEWQVDRTGISNARVHYDKTVELLAIKPIQSK